MVSVRKVSPSPKKNMPPVSKLDIESSSKMETKPVVNKTPAGMMAHQCSELLKYINKKLRPMPPKTTMPLYVFEKAGKSKSKIWLNDITINVIPGIIHHQFCRLAMNWERQKIPAVPNETAQITVPAEPLRMPRL